MGVQVTLKDIQSGFLTATQHTANNTLIESGFDKTLDRTANVNNAMAVNFDVGLNRVINQEAGISDKDGVNLSQLNIAIGAIATGDVLHLIERQLGSAAVSKVFTFSTLTYTTGSDNLSVYRNGVLMDLAEDYTETNSTSITLTFDPNSFDKFKFDRWATL